MAKYKNISGVDLRSDFVPQGIVEAGEIVDVPTEQADGTPLIWHPDIWEPVDKKAKAAAKTTDDDAVKADEVTS